MKMINLAVLALLTMPAVLVSASNCWKDAYGRGVGEVITSCREGEEKNGALCYPICKAGFYGVGPVCWQDCPSGFRNDGAFCYKPSSYGRGVGYAIWNEDNCKRDNPDLGCEKWGAVWYPKCKANFHNVACCVCSPDCPSGMTDIGISCAKESYGRGVGSVLTCAPGLEMSGLLCYPPCKSGYSGNGPVCWQQCPAGKADCSAMCTDNADGCSDTVKSITVGVVALAVAAATAATGGQVDMLAIIKSLGSVAIDLANGICEKPASEFEII